MSQPELHERVENDFRNHPPTHDAIHQVMDDLTEAFIALGHHLVNRLPPGREQSLALTHLEQCSMWSKAAVARHQDEVYL